MPIFVPPETLEHEEQVHQGGFTTWGPDAKFKRLPSNMLPNGTARRVYMHREVSYEDYTDAIHVEYLFPDSDVILVAYWTHSGQRIA